MSQTMFEKLQLEDEKNLLIQGLPSTIEKQFSKLSFSKNVTQLLKVRKVDFALVFALNSHQLQKIFAELSPALNLAGQGSTIYRHLLLEQPGVVRWLLVRA